MSRPVYAPQGAQEARGTGYAVRGFCPAPFSPSPSPAHQCVARAADAASRGRGGRRCAPPPPLPQAGLGSNQVRGGSHPAPRTPLRCVPSVCHPAFSSGLPEARLESRSWPSRSVVTATFDGPQLAEPVLTTPQDGDTPVIVLTRACGRVAPVTRGSDALAHGFPGGARTRRSELLPPRSRDAPTGIRSAGRQPPRTEFHAFSLARRRVDPAVPRIFGTPAVLAHRGRYWGRFPTSHLGRHGESRYRHAAFMAFFYDPYALVGTSGSRRSVPRPHSYRAQPRTASPRGRLLAAFRSLTCVVTTAPRRAFGPRVIRTRIRPLRERSAHRTRIETGPQGPSIRGVSLPSGRTQACHAHLASAENRSSEAGRTEQMAVWTLRPASEGHLTGVGRPV